MSDICILCRMSNICILCRTSDICILDRKATARVPARSPLIPRLYYDYETPPQAVLSRDGGG